jgi:hypothetical protein
MVIAQKICTVVLLLSLLALAGYPEVAQESGSSQPSESRGGGGGE